MKIKFFKSILINIKDIENVEYHCGKAEDILPNILRRFANERVVAIVDPPRAGLRNIYIYVKESSYVLNYN